MGAPVVAGKGSALGAVVDAMAPDGGLGAHTHGAAAADDLFARLDEEMGAPAGLPAPRRKGRPPGAVNRTTADVVRWLQVRGYTDPMQFLAEMISKSPRELAAELRGIDDVARVTFEEALEAGKLQRQAAAELMPYMHRQQPKELVVPPSTARPLVVIAQMSSDPEARAKVVEHQWLDEDEAVASHVAPSHGGGNRE